MDKGLKHHSEKIKQELEASDIQLIRLLEDLIEVLVMKGIINYTDLPLASMQKILDRKNLRDKLNATNPFSSEKPK